MSDITEAQRIVLVGIMRKDNWRARWQWFIELLSVLVLLALAVGLWVVLASGAGQ